MGQLIEKARETLRRWSRLSPGPRVAGRILLTAVAFVLVTAPAFAMEGMEAEENISELLPANLAATPEETLATRAWAVLPQVGYGPDTGILAGVKYAHRNLFDSGIAFDFGGTYSLNNQQSVSVSLGTPRLFGEDVVLFVRGLYDLDPQREFFGLGNNEQGPEPASTNEFQQLGGSVTLGWRVFDRLSLNFQFGSRQAWIRNGKRDGDIPFTPEAFPDLPGINGGVVNPMAISLVWNTRDDVMRPTHGWRVILKAIHTDKALFSDFEYSRFIFDAGYLRAFNNANQVVGARINGEWIEAPFREVPFWELTELGGPDTLRGFFPHRFLGKGRALVNLEFRSRIVDFDFLDWWHVHFDGVIFGDGGRVFIDGDDIKNEFDIDSDTIEHLINDFQFDYGFGFRLALSEALLARIDVGFSDEERGLVYLTFGHTF